MDEAYGVELIRFNNLFYSQMWVTALSIAKYNNIKKQNMQNKSFIMSLEDFI